MSNARSVVRAEPDEHSLRLAVLIDADNAQASVIEGLLAEVARFGEATVKRIYGDFTSTRSASWKEKLQRHAIKPIQQFAYTKGKNATDSTMIIDAMDLLYTRNFDGFCLVSSDSDFTGLAMRIREEGLRVLGFGEHKTPDAFRNACHKFIFTEVLRTPAAKDKVEAEAPAAPAEKEKAKPKAKKASTRKKADAKDAKKKEEDTGPVFPRRFVLDALEQSSDESGWAQLGTFGSYLNKLQPDFDSRLYGYRKLSDLVKAMKDLFVTEERVPPGSVNKQLYVRAR